MEGALLLSEAVLDNTECRRQHSEVLEHMIMLVQNITKKHGEELPVVKKAIQLLKARYHII